MKIIFTLALLFLVGCFIYAQSKHDYHWLLGYTPNLPEDYFGGSHLDFHQNPVEVSFFEIPIAFDAISMICDSIGQLLFYSKGCQVINAGHELMINGDSINSGRAGYKRAGRRLLLLSAFSGK